MPTELRLEKVFKNHLEAELQGSGPSEGDGNSEVQHGEDAGAPNIGMKSSRFVPLDVISRRISFRRISLARQVEVHLCILQSGRYDTSVMHYLIAHHLQKLTRASGSTDVNMEELLHVVFAS